MDNKNLVCPNCGVRLVLADELELQVVAKTDDAEKVSTPKPVDSVQPPAPAATDTSADAAPVTPNGSTGTASEAAQ